MVSAQELFLSHHCQQGSDGKESPAMQETRVQSWLGSPWRREWLLTPAFLTGELH